MSSLDLNKQSLTFTCPECSHKISEIIGHLKNNPKITCSRCGSNINIQANELKKGIDKAEASLKQLRDTIKKLGGR